MLELCRSSHHGRIPSISPGGFLTTGHAERQHGHVVADPAVELGEHGTADAAGDTGPVPPLTASYLYRDTILNETAVPPQQEPCLPAGDER